MKILFLYSYYKPENTSGAHLADDLRKGLAKAGHTMQIYTPTPTRGVTKEIRREYKKKKNETDLNGALKVHRFALFGEGKNTLLRAFRYAICELQLLWFGLIAKKPDIIPFGSTPPINGIVATILKKLRKIPFVYTVQDLFPESLVSTGMTREGSLLWKIGNFVSNLTYRNAEHIIVISDSMKEKLVSKGVPQDKVSVIYNWIDEDSAYPVSREENKLFSEFSLDTDKFYITYAGNLGNSQNVGLIVDCAEKLQEYKDIQFVIFGDGSEKEKLLEKIDALSLKNISVFPMQSYDRVPEVYSLGDASFVCCKKGVGTGAFPSKAATIMATGRAVIASFDAESDLCTVINNGNAGLCSEAEDVNGAVTSILKLYNDRDLCKQLGQNGRKLIAEKFSKEKGLSAYIDIYERAVKK